MFKNGSTKCCEFGFTARCSEMRPFWAELGSDISNWRNDYFECVRIETNQNCDVNRYRRLSFLCNRYHNKWCSGLFTPGTTRGTAQRQLCDLNLRPNKRFLLNIQNKAYRWYMFVWISHIGLIPYQTIYRNIRFRYI